MNYFQFLSIGFGIFTIVVRSLIHILGQRWTKFELNTAYTAKRPAWIWIAAAIGLGIIALTWYKFITTDIPWSLVITLIVTLTLIKLSQLLFNYENFRKFVQAALVEDRRIIVAINTVTIILGLVMIWLGVIIYRA